MSAWRSPRGAASSRASWPRSTRVCSTSAGAYRRSRDRSARGRAARRRGRSCPTTTRSSSNGPILGTARRQRPASPVAAAVSDAVSPRRRPCCRQLGRNCAREPAAYPGGDVAPPQLGNGHEAVVRAEGDQTHEQAGLQQQQPAVRRLPEAGPAPALRDSPLTSPAPTNTATDAPASSEKRGTAFDASRHRPSPCSENSATTTAASPVQTAAAAR